MFAMIFAITPLVIQTNDIFILIGENLVTAVCKSLQCFTPSSTTKHLNKDKLCLLILPSQFKYAHACLFCLHFLYA